MKEAIETYRHLFESLNDAVFLSEASTGNILETNKKAEELLGRKRDAIIGVSQCLLHPQDKAGEYSDRLMARIERGQAADYDSTVVGKDGDLVPVNISASLLMIGEKRFVLSVFRDIRKRRQMEERLLISQQSEQLKKLELEKAYAELSTLFNRLEAIKNEWETTMDCIGDMLLLTDAGGNIQRCNKALTEFTGMTYNDVIGRPWKALLLEHGINTDEFSGDESAIEVFHRQTGRWFVINRYPYQAVRVNAVSGLVIALHDTTELKTLAESLEITNSTLDTNRQELQFALDEISFLLQEVEKNMDLSVRFAISGMPSSDSIYRLGENFNNMMSLLEGQHKKLQAAYTDLKTAQSHILHQEKMASIGQLAAGVAHEINNPMGFISSNLTTLRKYVGKLSEFIKVQSEAVGELAGKCGDAGTDTVLKKTGELKRALKIDIVSGDIDALIAESLDGAERVKKIVQNLKSFSRLDEAGQKMADINSGIESTINIVWNELKYKVTLKKEYGEIPQTLCNPGELNQVFMNILVNAAHAIEKQGEITVKTWHDGGDIYVAISDTGSGIPEDKLNRIFEPFFTTKEVGKGTGLGLSIAYDIIKKHNGEIMVDSEVGRGTKFTIRIPVAEGKTE